MGKSTVYFVVALAILAVSPACWADPIFTNPDFNGNAVGWTVISGGCVSPSLYPGGPGDTGDNNGYGYLSTFGDPYGSYALNECGSGSTDPVVGQTISGFTIGDEYEVGIDVYIETPDGGYGSGKSFGIFLNSEPNDPILITEAPADGQWHLETAEFTATSTTELIMFAAELDPRTPGGPSYPTDVPAVIDNATLVDLSESSAIPEPATLLLCASGLAALLRMRRLPRRKAVI